MRFSDGDRLGQVQSLVRAFSILEGLAEAEGGLTLTEIARVVGLPRSTTHRLLTTMEARHFVEFEAASHRWLVGAKAASVGAAAPRNRLLARVAQPVTESLMKELQATVSISMAGSDVLRVIGQASMTGLAPVASLGETLPIHASASGKAVLAACSGREMDRFFQSASLDPLTDRSLIRRGEVERQVEEVRRVGYAIDDQECRSGTRCVAAAILDTSGAAMGAVSISAPAAHLRDDVLATLGRRAMDAAGRVRAAFADSYHHAVLNRAA